MFMIIHLMTCFNPRSPCGERRFGWGGNRAAVEFQPTLPLRGATNSKMLVLHLVPVSTHAPLAGSDQVEFCITKATEGFNPRSPCGERRVLLLPVHGTNSFNPRSPCGERLLVEFQNILASGFNPRSPCGERHCPSPPTAHRSRFNPRSPCGERPAVPSVPSCSASFQPTLPLRGATLAISA